MRCGKGKAGPKAISLIEFVVVAFIIGTLVAVLLPVWSKHVRKSKVARLLQDLRTLEQGIKMYRSEVRYMPSDILDTCRKMAVVFDPDCLSLTLRADGKQDYEFWMSHYAELPKKNPFGWFCSAVCGTKTVRSGYQLDFVGGTVQSWTILTGDVPRWAFEELDRQIDGGDGELQGKVRYNALLNILGWVIDMR